MGPCLFRHGKTGALADLPALTNYLLQWGHVFSDMVRQGCPGDRDLRLRASMGPCLFRHGKHLQPGPPPKVILMTLQWGHVFSDMVSGALVRTTGRPPAASMGPCLFRHGKSTMHFILTDKQYVASMGPCLFRHGKGRDDGNIAADVRPLQWGHVFSDMVRACLYMRTLKSDKRWHKIIIIKDGY